MSLYPVAPLLQEFDLEVSEIHTLNVRTYGNPRGIPVVYLHGGPGGGTKPENTKYFDSNSYYIVLFDQRGCGKSKPFADLRENTTWDLVADIEKIRRKLNIATWYVFGGSWGSTLSLAYGIRHPEACRGFILRGIFLGTEPEIRHLYIDGTSRQFPENFEIFLQPVDGKTENIIERYYSLLTSEDKEVRLRAAKAWSQWEGAVSRLLPNPKSVEEMGEDSFADAFARIECHYFRNNCFFESPNYLLDNISKITHLPCHIVHGRYDLVCAPEIGWKLHKAWRGSTLEFIPDAGHSSEEPGTALALTAAMDSFISK
jgi:proline iminopeptidase